MIDSLTDRLTDAAEYTGPGNPLVAMTPMEAQIIRDLLDQLFTTANSLKEEAR